MPCENTFAYPNIQVRTRVHRHTHARNDILTHVETDKMQRYLNWVTFPNKTKISEKCIAQQGIFFMYFVESFFKLQKIASIASF